MIDGHTLISKEDDLSFRGFMEREVYSKIDADLVMPESQRIFPEPGKENEIMELIHNLGGIDICFGGVGINGHIAFNEPGTPFDSTVRVSEIDEVTKSVGTKYFTNVPQLSGGITIGLKEICASKNIILIVFGEHKQEIIKKFLDSPVTTTLPASVLKTIPDAQFWYV